MVERVVLYVGISGACDAVPSHVSVRASVLRVCMQRSLDEVVMFDKEQHAIMGDAHQRERLSNRLTWST